MLKSFMKLWKKESLCDEAWQSCLTMLRESRAMLCDAVQALHTEAVHEANIYKRDRMLNKFERHVRRNIVTHLAVSTNPDINTALVLTAIVIDIERIGDYTKNIVELASMHPGAFTGEELGADIGAVEASVATMFELVVPCLESSDAERARQILGEHQMVVDRVEDCLHELIAGRLLSNNSGEAVTAALYLRYLKRVSAHVKNVATSVVNPFYRIGFREKTRPAALKDR